MPCSSGGANSASASRSARRARGCWRWCWARACRWSRSGLFAGACASLPLLPLIRALPADSAPFDPLALGLAAIVLLLVAAAACLVPAMRAARVDALVVMRCE